LWNSVRHENILPFVGAILGSSADGKESEPQPIIALVSYWVEGGTILDHLNKEPHIDRLNLVVSISPATMTLD
jgi:hypothetical protein